MMMVVIGGFVVCWFPFAIMFVLFPTNESAAIFFDSNPKIVELITWLGKKNKIFGCFVNIIYISGYVNSTLNPIIYVFMSPTFKKMFKNWYKSVRN